MGRAGSGLALDNADALVVDYELATIPHPIVFSRHARQLVIAKLVSAATCITGVTRDLLGHLPPPLGVTRHEGSTVIVGLNGMRLLSPRAWMPRARRARCSAARNTGVFGALRGRTLNRLRADRRCGVICCVPLVLESRVRRAGHGWRRDTASGAEAANHCGPWGVNRALSHATVRQDNENCFQ